MNEDIKARWVEALESGDYMQGTGALARAYSDTEVKYCCLGVLCEIAVKEGVIPPPANTFILEYSGQSDVLPNVVRDWAELDHVNPMIRINGSISSLAAFNDTAGTFPQVAQVIREQL